MRTSLLRALAIAAALIAGAPALAQAEIQSMAVRYGDLDLAHADGRATLDRRVAKAAKKVCGVENSLELGRMMLERRCTAAAVAGAQGAVTAAIERHSTAKLAQASASPDVAVR